MIAFKNDHLALRGFCKLLSDFVPRDLHVPVVFLVRGKGAPLGRVRVWARAPWIEIYLHNIFFEAILCGSTGIWKKLLKVALHEFGHVATARMHTEVNEEAYKARGKEYLYVEWLADAWQQRQFNTLLDFDSRLGQPYGYLTGYLGARFFRHMKYWQTCDSGSAKARFVTERRLLKGGGQFTIGRVTHDRCIKKLLRSEWSDLGIPYIDAAGRKHKLYTDGDVREIRWREDHHIPTLRRRAAERAAAEQRAAALEQWIDVPF